MAPLDYKDTLMLLCLDKLLGFHKNFIKNQTFETDSTTVWTLRHKI